MRITGEAKAGAPFKASFLGAFVEIYKPSPGRQRIFLTLASPKKKGCVVHTFRVRQQGRVKASSGAAASPPLCAGPPPSDAGPSVCSESLPLPSLMPAQTGTCSEKHTSWLPWGGPHIACGWRIPVIHITQEELLQPEISRVFKKRPGLAQHAILPHFSGRACVFF